MEDQYERYVCGKISMDLSGSGYCTYMNTSTRLEKVGSEGKEQNLDVSLKFSIIECVRGRYIQGIMG
jgi:hypothetical protein